MTLFDEFDGVKHQQWIEQITSDLKGKDFNENLVWNSNEGIIVHPFYNSSFEDIYTTPIKNTNGWKIRETILINTIENANKKALIALKGGATSILFVGQINTHTEMTQLLKDIQTEIIEVHFYNSSLNKTLELAPNINGSISYDYLNEYLTSGKWFSSKENDFEELKNITGSTQKIKTITVNGSFYKNIGYTAIQEVAFILNQGVEYFNILTDKGIDAKIIASKIQFTFGMGTNYFFEIAKIRAARILWKLILNQYKVNDISMTLNCETSIPDYFDDDKNYNILRNTTKAMSAIIGGCDSLSILPHDNTESNLNFSNRISRNIQHLLKEEAFFDKVNNPADGSYFIEYLTTEIANKAWILFKEIESKGGFINCVDNGFIKSELNQKTSV